ncbi:MAG TPA: multiprotein bridging factor aMBF1 [Candidatus Nanoarchaeia archaeon]|nr:multiprotein bridging factor aMBF1 [Candidatus Nanoarchaeia archaeon]
MAVCEMCGNTGNLLSVEVEGVEMQVCNNCSKYGKAKARESNYHSSRPVQLKSEMPDVKIVDNYAFLLRRAREQKNMSQEEFAKLLNEKESIVAKWEQGTLKPRVELANRIGRILKINLLEKDDPGAVAMEKKSGSGELTLGDFIKVRKKN